MGRTNKRLMTGGRKTGREKGIVSPRDYEVTTTTWVKAFDSTLVYKLWRTTSKRQGNKHKIYTIAQRSGFSPFSIACWAVTRKKVGVELKEEIFRELQRSTETLRLG